jgi:Carboxypeptidase regulatory-like domain
VSTFLRQVRNFMGVVALTVAPLMCQTGLGTVSGTVRDASSAAVPKATITLTNTATGVNSTANTNSAGLYSFSNVQIGSYVLAVAATGFEKWSGTFQVQAGQTVTVDPTLNVGNVQTKVEVSGAASLVTTEGAQVSDVKDALRIHDLPLNGRQIANLFDLTPGVVGGGSPRTNGMKVGSTEMVMDGVSLVDRFGGGMARVQPGLDTVQEFRVETAGSRAQFSRPATIELVTRSGTNELHGAAFETFRNNAAGLRDRARQDGNTPAKLIRNEFGFWAGGPVIKNKTFWFIDWEAMKQRQQTFATTGVPTAAMWAGDLSNITDANGDKITIYDPMSTNGPNGTRTPFPNNIIPANRISPYAKIFQSVTPTPSGPNANGNPWIEQNFQAYYPIPEDQSTLTLKGDHNFSEKDTISGSFTRSPDSIKQFGGQYGFPPPGCTNCGGTARRDYSVYSDYIRYNHVFSPTLLNQFMAASHRSVANYGTLGDTTKWADKLGLPNPFGVTGWPTVYTDASNLLYYGGWDGDNLHNQNLTSFEIDDDATWVKGKHRVQFGFKGRQEYNNIRELQQAEGSHSFYSNWTALYDPSAQAAAPYTGSGFAELLLGLPTALRNQYNRGYFYFQQKEIGTYINDTWKVTPRLTLDLGLRWDHWTPYHEKYDRLVNLDPTNYAGFTVITPHNTTIESLPNIPSGVLASWKARGLNWVTADSVSGFPKDLIQNYWKDIGPRFGAAYRINDKTVVRAGYGMYYWPMPLSQILQASRTNPPLNLGFVNSTVDRNGAIPNYGLLNAPGTSDFLPNATVNVTGVQGIGTTSRSIVIMDPHNWADDRMQQWTLTVEREVMKDTTVNLTYIGTHGSNLEQRLAWNSAEAELNYQTQTGLAALPGGQGADLRRPNPNWNGYVESHVGYSNSHSIQAQIQRRFSSGLSFQAFYVYDHALTTSDEGGFGSGSGGAMVPENTNILGNPKLSLSQRLRLVYYNSGSVPPHQIRWNGIYELPFGKGKRYAGNSGRALDAVVGGWQLAFNGQWRSGFWMGVNNSEYLFGNPALDPSQRLTMNIFGKNQELYFRGDFDPTQATNVDLTKLTALVPTDRSQRVLHPVGPAFDNKVPFTLANGQVRPTTITDLQTWNSQNFFLGPRAWNQDLSVFKYFSLTERVRLRVTADFFNVFNHPNDLNPNTTTGLIDLSRQANDPRIIQFSGRLEW